MPASVPPYTPGSLQSRVPGRSPLAHHPPGDPGRSLWDICPSAEHTAHGPAPDRPGRRASGACGPVQTRAGEQTVSSLPTQTPLHAGPGALAPTPRISPPLLNLRWKKAGSQARVVQPDRRTAAGSALPHSGPVPGAAGEGRPSPRGGALRPGRGPGFPVQQYPPSTDPSAVTQHPEPCVGPCPVLGPPRHVCPELPALCCPVTALPPLPSGLCCPILPTPNQTLVC